MGSEWFIHRKYPLFWSHRVFEEEKGPKVSPTPTRWLPFPLCFQIEWSGKTEGFTRSCIIPRRSNPVLCAYRQRWEPRRLTAPPLLCPGNVFHPNPKAAHLHALNVLQQDVSDSLVISSDVGIWAAFPENKGKRWWETKALAVEKLPERVPAPGSYLNSDLPDSPSSTSPFSGYHWVLAPEGDLEISQSFCRHKEVDLFFVKRWGRTILSSF